MKQELGLGRKNRSSDLVSKQKSNMTQRGINRPTNQK